MVESAGVDRESGGARLAVVDRRHRVRAGGGGGADVAGAGAVGADGEGGAEGEVAQRVARGVEALGGVALRATGADRGRAGADHDVVEGTARDLQGGGARLAELGSGDGVRPGGRGGARGTGAGAAGDGEGDVAGDVSQRVVVLVAALGGVGLRAAARDRGRGRAQENVVEGAAGDGHRGGVGGSAGVAGDGVGAGGGGGAAIAGADAVG